MIRLTTPIMTKITMRRYHNIAVTIPILCRSAKRIPIIHGSSVKLIIHPFSSSSRNSSNSSSSGSSNNGWNWNTKPNTIDSTNNNDVSSSSTATSTTATAKSILSDCANLHTSTLIPLNDRLRGPLDRDSSSNNNNSNNTSTPFVLLVGNHSSGKSSFINYVLGRKIQTAGVAPTDDCFTVIAPGPMDVDQDGPALIGDPDLGFAGLRKFGPTLVHHTALKVRCNVNDKGFMMIDSPGMIDSPVVVDKDGDNRNVVDRGYDFPGVVRWLATRADIVLLFFDPDKPGTTGETLDVLLSSLAGMDHKLLIVLNKADQFKRIHDFARAYGSLCWNLSKVIPRKDLPRIFTMCLPVNGNDNDNDDGKSNSNNGLAELHRSRDDVVAEVMKAPKRRVDNVITNLYDSTQLLLAHAKVGEHLRANYANKRRWGTAKATSVLFGGLSLSIGGGVVLPQVPPEIVGGSVAVTVLLAGCLRWYELARLESFGEDLLDLGGSRIDEAFARAYFTRGGGSDVGENGDAANVWARVRKHLALTLQAVGLDNHPNVENGDIEELERILDVEVPRLRRLASPRHFGSSSNSKSDLDSQ